MLQTLDHPGVVKLYATFSDENNLYIVLDYALNKDFSGFLASPSKCIHHDSSMSEFHNFNVRKYYVSQLVSILAYLRTQKVVHRDLKPSNLLLNEKWQLVLGDFGTSKQLTDLQLGNDLKLKKACSSNQILTTKPNLLEEESDDELVGTEEYISPEALHGSSVSFASDLWSFGVIVWQIFSKANTTPFADSCQEKTFQRIKNCEYSMPEDAPEVVQDLIKKLLLKDPSKRLGADDINKLKAHPFFEGVNFDSMYDNLPPLLDKHKRLSLQQQKELKFLPRK